MLCVFFFFFFSSRRRHTRFDCDWSSDVCSSDLSRRAAQLLGFDPREPKHGLGYGSSGIDQSLHGRGDAFGRERDRADLYHSVAARIETRSLEVKGCVFRHRRTGFYGRRRFAIRALESNEEKPAGFPSSRVGFAEALRSFPLMGFTKCLSWPRMASKNNKVAAGITRPPLRRGLVYLRGDADRRHRGPEETRGPPRQKGPGRQPAVADAGLRRST